MDSCQRALPPGLQAHAGSSLLALAEQRQAARSALASGAETEVQVGARVAMRPRAVRIRKPCWIRNGSSTSSMVPRSSPTAAARLSMPTGPPSNFSMIVSRSCGPARRSPSDRPPACPAPPSPPRRSMMPVGLHLAQSRARGAAAGWRCAACRASASAMRRAPPRRSARRGCAPSARRSRSSSSSV